MEDKYVEILTECTKKNKKDSKISKKQICSILTEQYNKEKNYDEIVFWFLKSNKDVITMFFKENKITDEDAEHFATAIQSCSLLKSKMQIYYFRKLMTIIAVFLKKDYKSDSVVKILLRTIEYGTNNGQYCKELMTSFNYEIISGNLFDKLENIVNGIEKEYTKNTIRSFFVYINKENSNKKNNSTKQNSNESISQSSVNDNEIIAIINALKENNDALSKQVEKLTETNSIITTLKISIENDKNALKAKDSEISRLKEELNKEKSKNSDLMTSNINLKNELDENTSKIEELTERLKAAFEIDQANQKQELETLKKKVSDSLKLEYDEFQSSDNSFNEDNFQANYAAIQRIFKTLKRFGFNFE